MKALGIAYDEIWILLHALENSNSALRTERYITTKICVTGLFGRITNYVQNKGSKRQIKQYGDQI